MMYSTLMGVCASGLLVLMLPFALMSMCGGDEPSGENASAANSGKERIRLAISNVSAEQKTDGVDFHCECVLLNETGTVLKVRSHCYSAFDGLHLVVFGPDGARLGQDAYVSSQSPYSLEGRLFPLNIGENLKSLSGFLVSTIPHTIDKVGVLLIGTLPGSGDPCILCSNMVTIQIKIKEPEKTEGDDAAGAGPLGEFQRLKDEGPDGAE